MSVSSSWPDESTLRRFLTDALSPEEMAAVADYLEQHPEALDTLNALAANDTLVAALRSGREAAGGDSSGLRALLEQLQQMPEPRPNATEEAAVDGSAGSDTSGDGAVPGDVDVGEVLRELLAPAEGPNELGRLASYRVLRLLGRGGMGLVFEAEDDHLQRRVALKAMYPRAARNASARQRFLREARAMAAIDHDHIVHVYQVGEERGVPFLAMPLLEGTTLEALLTAGTPLDPAEVVRIGRQIAEGLAAAHDRGLIHRDVKPSNVWVETERGGRVKLLDFGLARRVSEEQGLTRSGTVVGTPAYMAPEQARGLAIDGRADLFGLGCVLYRLTTGRAPFTGSDTLAILTALATDTPPLPALVNPTVPAALSALVMQLLEKDPARRPASARDVAAALDRIDLTAPLPAAPLRRRSRASLLVVAAMVLLAGGAALLAPVLVRLATPNGELVLKVDDRTLEVVVKQDGAVIHDRTKERHFVLTAGRDGQVEFVDPETGVRVLTKTFTIERGRKTVVEATVREPAVSRAPVEKIAATTEPLSPEDLVARPVKLPGVASWTLETVGHRGAVEAVAFSPKEEWVASAGADGAVRIWNGRTAALHRVLVRHPERVDNLAWSPDGRYLASTSKGDRRTTCVWQVEDGQLLRTLPAASYYVAWSPDSKLLAVEYPEESITTFDILEGKATRSMRGVGQLWRLTRSPDGKTLAAIRRDGDAVLRWEAIGQPLPPLKVETGCLLALAWSPDGSWLAAAGSDKKVRLWDAAGKLIHTATAGDVVHALAWSPDSKLVASVGAATELWQATDGKRIAAIAIGGQALAWSSDGKRLAVVNQQGTITLIDRSGKTEHTIRGHETIPTRATLAPDGKRLAFTYWLPKVWDVERRALLSCGDLGGHAYAWSPDGQQLAMSRERDTVLLDGKTGEVVQTIDRGKPVGAVAWSGDGKHLAVCGDDYSLRVWDVQAHRQVQDVAGYPEHARPRPVIAWAPDGVTVSYRTETAWVLSCVDIATGRKWALEGADVDMVTAAAWSPDGKAVAVGYVHGAIRLHDRSMKRLEEVKTGVRVEGLVWLAGGRELACGLANGTVRVWDLTNGRLGQETPRFAWSGPLNGRLMVSECRGGLVCWDVPTGRRHGALIVVDNSRVVVIGPEGHWHSDGVAVEMHLIYVVTTDRGQELFTPVEFARRFGFHNDPDKAQLLPR